MNRKDIFLRCEDYAETAVFSRYDMYDINNEPFSNYELTIEDSYCGGDYMGIKGRFKRTWKAFWAKPIVYTGVYCADKERIKKFLNDCLKLVDEE